VHAGLCEVETFEDDVQTRTSLQAELEEVIRCRSPFHVNVEKIAGLLRAIRGLIDDPRTSFAELDALIEHVEARIFFASPAEELAFNVKNRHENVRLINDAYCSWETALEQIFVERLLRGDANSLNDYRLNKRFQRLLKRETSLLRGRHPKRALFIGSGPFPISAIWLHQMLGIPVDGLDVSLDAVERSRELIDRLELSDSIRIIHEPLQHYDVSSYDVILVALLAKPKAAILDNIRNTARPDCEIICRTSFGLRSVIYEPTKVCNEMLERFHIEDARIISGSGDDTISSLLLKIA
jgi:hypothetical protein